MTLAKGPRPWSVRLFALLFMAAATLGLIDHLGHLHELAATLGDYAPDMANRDEAIVAASARFTIALIPVALIWLLASRVARWLVSGMALLKLAGFVTTYADGLRSLALASMIASLAGAALLFTPSASGWLRRKGEGDDAGVA